MKLHLPKTLLTAIVAALVTPVASGATQLYSGDNLGTGENVLAAENVVLDEDQELKSDVTIYGHGWDKPEGHSLTLSDTTPVTVSITGNLCISSMCHLNISGGSLSATGDFLLGHGDLPNYPAYLNMSGGDLSVSKIVFRRQTDANTISITGGTLTITGETAITTAGTPNPAQDYTSTVFIGGEEDRIVTLKTGATNAVTFDYSKLTLGNVTIDANNNKAITIKNATLTGTITHSGNTGNLQLGDVKIADDAQAVTISNATLNGRITDIANAGKLTLSGEIALGEKNVTLSEGHFVDADGTEVTSGNAYKGGVYTANLGDLTVAEGTTFTFLGEQLAYDATTDTYSKTMIDTSTYYVRTNTDYTEELTSAANIYVIGNATLNANGNPIESKTIILQEGATLANTGEVIGNDKRQNSHITLEGDATLNAASSMGIIGSGYETSYLELKNHTLAKTGEGTLTLINTDISAGTVDIREGNVVLKSQGNGAITPHETVFNVGETRQLTFDNFGGTAAGNVILKATGTGTINVSTNTTIPGNTGDSATSTFAGTVNVTGGTLSIGSDTSDGNSGWKVSAEKMGIQLNGGNVYYFGFDSTLGDLTVASGATYTIHATGNGANDNFVAHQTLSIAESAILTIKANWEGNVSFTQLTGKGNLLLAPGAATPALKVNIDTVNNFEGTITNNDTTATLTIGKDNTSTVQLNSTIVNNGTLNLKGQLTAAVNGSYEVASAGGGIEYSEGGENGFRITKGDTLYLVKGGTINLTGDYTFQYNGNPSSSLTKTDAGLTFTAADETETTFFFVRNGTVDEQALLTGNKVTGDTAYSIEGGTLQAAGDISNNRLSYTSGTLEVSQGHKLTIDTDKDNAASLLLNTAGEGNIEINNATTVTLTGDSATKLTGDLIVRQGSTLELAESADAATPTAADFSSLKKLTLEGSLCIAVDEVTVKGISGDSGAISSGAQAGGTADAFVGDGTNRTLIIDTEDGGNYGTTATLGDHLNLTKKGTGSQTFAGAVPNAIGKVTVEAGSLTFANHAALEVEDLTVQRGATLSVHSAMLTAAEGESAFNGVRVSHSATLEGGSTIDGGLDLTGTSTLTVNNSANGSITLSGTLILPTGKKVTLSGDILDTLAGLGKGDSLALFSGVTSLQLGNDSYTELEASDATDLSNYFTFDGRALEQGSYQLGYANNVVSIHSLIPEPTTATLSLLALMGLAARRRRR